MAVVIKSQYLIFYLIFNKNNQSIQNFSINIQMRRHIIITYEMVLNWIKEPTCILDITFWKPNHFALKSSLFKILSCSLNRSKTLKCIGRYLFSASTLHIIMSSDSVNRYVTNLQFVSNFVLQTKKFHYLCMHTHCSYLDIYISQNIRLCKGDFAGKFQTILQAKGINFLSENWDLLFSFSF